MTIEKLIIEGRIVWGHPGKEKPKVNYTNKQPVIKDGKQVMAWEFGLAVPKAIFDAQFWPQFYAEAQRLYPQGPGRDFSWKLTDGDGFDKNNKPYNTREGYAGCRILNISTQAFAPPIYKFENGAYRKIESHEIKCGDFVAVQLNVQAHNEKDGGLYLNPNMLELIGYGQEIVSAGGDPMEAFGGIQRQLPQGASATPISSAPTGAMPPAPGGYAPAPQAYGVPPTPAAPMPQQAPAHLPPPAHDFVHNATGQVPVGAPPAPGGYAPQPGYPAPAPAPMPQPGYGAPQPGNYSAPPAPPAPTAGGAYPAPMNAAPGYASPATPYPSNLPPGMPPQR